MDQTGDIVWSILCALTFYLTLKDDLRTYEVNIGTTTIWLSINVAERNVSLQRLDETTAVQCRLGVLRYVALEIEVDIVSFTKYLSPCKTVFNL